MAISITKQAFYATELADGATYCADIWGMLNPFTKQLIQNILTPCYNRFNFPLFVFDDYVNTVGITKAKANYKLTAPDGTPIAKEDVYVDDTPLCVVNINAMPGWFDTKTNLMKEIASSRVEKQSLPVTKLSAAQTKLLLTEYLLRNYLCYVEVYQQSAPGKDGTVGVTHAMNKFLATRNIELLGYLSDPARLNNGVKQENYMSLNKDLTDPKIFSAYKNALVMETDDYTGKGVSYVKLTKTAKSNKFSITAPRGALAKITPKMTYRIIPYFMLSSMSKLITKTLENNILEFTYRKDSLVERKLTSTLNYNFLRNIYNSDVKATEMLEQSSTSTISNGYMRIPDVQTPISESGMRALDFRISSVKLVNIGNFKNNYKDVTFNLIVPLYKEYVQLYRGNRNMLIALLRLKEFLMLQAQRDKELKEINHYRQRALHKGNDPALVSLANALQQKSDQAYFGADEAVKNTTMSNETIVSTLEQWANNQLLYGSTAFQKKLHDWMLLYPQIFVNYASKVCGTTAIPV